MTWREVRVQTVVQQARETIDPGALGCPLVEHYSIPSLEATGQPDVISPEEILSAKQMLHGGEVMLSRLNPRKARVLRVPEATALPAIASGEFVIMRPVAIDGDYLVYLLLSEEVRQYLHSCVQSVTRSHQRIRPEHLMKMSLTIPERDTQVGIAAFLDRRTAEIDALIDRKRQLIERLAEYRTALVTRTVTRGLPPEEARSAGLDPHPPMRDSEVEWLGEVPEHWEVKRLSRSVERADEKVEADGAEGLPYVGLEHVDSWTGNLMLLDNQPAPESLSNRFTAGDVLFGKLRPYLAKAFTADFDGLCSTEFLVLRPVGYEQRYLLHLLLTDGFISRVDASTYGAKMPRANWDFIGDSLLPQPPIAEQEIVSKFLDRLATETDALCARAETVIERLQEYRTALITAAVTGKIDVRDAAPAETEACRA